MGTLLFIEIIKVCAKIILSQKGVEYRKILRIRCKNNTAKYIFSFIYGVIDSEGW